MVISGKIQAFAIGLTTAAMMLCYNTEAAKAVNTSSATIGKFFQRAERVTRTATVKQISHASKIAGLWNWKANSSKVAARGLNGVATLSVTEDGGVAGMTSFGVSAKKIAVKGNAVLEQNSAAVRFTINADDHSYVVEANLSADGKQLVGAIQDATPGGSSADSQVYPFIAVRNTPVGVRH